MESRGKRRVSTRGKPRPADDLEVTHGKMESSAAGDKGDHQNKTSSVAGSDEEATRHGDKKVPLATPLKIPLPEMTNVSAMAGASGMAGDPAEDTPFTETTGLIRLRNKIQAELDKETRVKAEISPGLAQLRNTPGKGLKEKRRELIHKHEQIRQHSDKLSIGGGVTLWPNMNQMRLSRMEIISLIIICLVLVAGTGCLFILLHGEILNGILDLTTHANQFSKTHSVKYMGRSEGLKASIIGWHADFRRLLEVVDTKLNVSRPSFGYQVYIAIYLLAFGILVYFLVDSMWSKSKLSPGRIKKWVCLLVIVAQWTIMLFVLFVSAQRLESALVDNVLQLSEKLGELVEHDVDLSTWHIMVQYWRGRMLPPTSRGLIWVLGLVPVQDLTTYLQYYSLPVLTVLITPVVHLCLALRSVYSTPSKDL